jgi:type II secretory pathway pseudopilin PulG
MVELALVLVIMGIAGTLFYGVITGMIGKDKSGRAELALDNAREGITGYAVKSGYLPDYDPGGELILPERFPQEDAWGRELMYVLAAELAGEVLITSRKDTSLAVEIHDGAGTFPAGTPARTIGDIAFALVSTGPNQSVQVVLQGDPPETVKILRPGGPLSDGSGLEFDDLVEFVSLNELKAKITAVR